MTVYLHLFALKLHQRSVLKWARRGRALLLIKKIKLKQPLLRIKSLTNKLFETQLK